MFIEAAMKNWNAPKKIDKATTCDQSQCKKIIWPPATIFFFGVSGYPWGIFIYLTTIQNNIGCDDLITFSQKIASFFEIKMKGLAQYSSNTFHKFLNSRGFALFSIFWSRIPPYAYGPIDRMHVCIRSYAYAVWNEHTYAPMLVQNCIRYNI